MGRGVVCGRSDLWQAFSFVAGDFYHGFVMRFMRRLVGGVKRGIFFYTHTHIYIYFHIYVLLINWLTAYIPC